jgi:hypothetical protein
MMSTKAKWVRVFCRFSCVVTVFNVCPYEVSIEIPDLASLRLQLHPVQVTNHTHLFQLHQSYSHQQ